MHWECQYIDVDTPEAIISDIQSTIKSICQTVTYLKYTNHKSNKIDPMCHRIKRTTRDSLSICNIICLLSNALTKYEIINLKPIKSIFNDFKEHLSAKIMWNENDHKIDLITCKRWYINVNIHKESKSDYQKNDNNKIIFNKIAKTKTVKSQWRIDTNGFTIQ